MCNYYKDRFFLLNRKDGQTGDWAQDPPDIYQML